MDIDRKTELAAGGQCDSAGVVGVGTGASAESVASLQPVEGVPQSACPVLQQKAPDKFSLSEYLHWGRQGGNGAGGGGHDFLPDQSAIERHKRAGLPGVSLVRTSEEAYYAIGDLVYITGKDIDVLKNAVNHCARKRVRICTHENVESKLHEMFVCYTKTTNIAPHRHVGKDEIFYVMEGEMDFVVYNDDGTVRQTLPMGDPRSGKAFCVRVPMNTYHSVVLHSEFCVLHEATPGPFNRADTQWATW